jgi:hypothetical protein
MFAGISYGQTKARINKKIWRDTLEYHNTKLGFSFSYNEGSSHFFPDTSYEIDIWQWKSIKRFGISILCPNPYAIKWQAKDSNPYWFSPTDSVIKMEFGSGQWVEIYETQRPFHEIAFAEGFQQYLGYLNIHPEFLNDTIPKIINDSAWVMVGISGMPSRSKLLAGSSWRGIRGSSDTRVSSDDLNGTYIDEYVVSFLTYPRKNHSNLVMVFQEWPDNNDNRPHRIDEVQFYEMVSSIKWIGK